MTHHIEQKKREAQSSRMKGWYSKGFTAPGEGNQHQFALAVIDSHEIIIITITIIVAHVIVRGAF